MGYICITAHFIDENWRLNNKILAFCNLKPPHSGEEIAKAVYDCLKGWGLEKKVFTITLDNAKANDSMLNILKHRLLSSNGSSNGLLCNGKFLHVRCSAHILNLIVKAGLELATSLIENIRESVKFVKASESRKDSFAICVESAGITSGAGLSLDVSTRWNSTYEMLARALKFREAFAILNLYERGYKWLPSEEEWERGVKICDLLKPFNTISTYFSGVKYPTANVYFIQVWKIEMMLKKYADCEDDGDVRTMARAMQKKFAKY
uniref:hAT-like transposase RNase-H fold domain-containing protein n=1 Tax=Brassica oleracea var. oleracea TaxID=109376 RepID=A0A0D3DDY6_BRAOL